VKINTHSPQNPSSAISPYVPENTDVADPLRSDYLSDGGVAKLVEI
jgi:hypothetical protein